MKKDPWVYYKDIIRGKEMEQGRIMGIEDSLKYLVDTVTDMKKAIIDIEAKIDLKAYTLREIASGLGYSPQTLRNHPWKIPNYGKPDEGCNPGKWFYNTIVNWYAIPEDERRQKWEAMSSRERREAMGRAEKTKV